MLNWKYFDIIGKEVNEQCQVYAVYIKLKKDIDKSPELWIVSIVNFSDRSIGDPAYLGSYMKFREPAIIRRIEPRKDDLNKLKKSVLSLPQKELDKLNNLFEEFLKLKASKYLPKIKDYEEKLDFIFSKTEGPWEHRTFRTCLDHLSHEWKLTNLEEKVKIINTLKLVKYNIQELLKEYEDHYRSLSGEGIEVVAGESLRMIYNFENNLTEAKENNEEIFPDIIDEEIEEYLTELAARYNYFYQQTIISRKSEKIIRHECSLEDDLYFELAGLCFRKYFKIK